MFFYGFFLAIYSTTHKTFERGEKWGNIKVDQDGTQTRDNRVESRGLWTRGAHTNHYATQCPNNAYF